MNARWWYLKDERLMKIHSVSIFLATCTGMRLQPILSTTEKKHRHNSRACTQSLFSSFLSATHASKNFSKYIQVDFQCQASSYYQLSF